MAYDSLSFDANGHVIIQFTLTHSPDSSSIDGSIFTRGLKFYELSNHLGNVLATVSDRKLQIENAGNIDYFRADVRSVKDYYGFGMKMPGRGFEGSGYRFGFQGQETDKELFDGAVSYKYRIHDPRIGRFLSRDPLSPEYPWNSPYAFSENRVVDAVELEGLEAAILNAISDYLTQGYSSAKKAANQRIGNAEGTIRAFEISVQTTDPNYKVPFGIKVGAYLNAFKDFTSASSLETLSGKNPKATAFDYIFALSNFLPGGKLFGDGLELLADGVNKGRKFITPKAFSKLPRTGKVDPKLIKFSQGSGAEKFKDGRTVDGLIESLKKDPSIAENISAIRIVERNGEIFTLDNRRLHTFQETGVPIKFEKLDKVPKKETFKFRDIDSGDTNGEKLRIRRKRN